MAKIKHTKNELKSQKEQLRRFERFLPMLQLKKQQLKVEIQTIEAALTEKIEQRNAIISELDSWIELFSEDADIENLHKVVSTKIESGNIAGVNIPIFAGLEMKSLEPDLFLTPPWMDDASAAIRALLELNAEINILETQKNLIEEELRTTSQRVNLFEKVKIPECKENIRIIKIYLGDEQTAGVVRGKIAKKRADDTIKNINGSGIPL